MPPQGVDAGHSLDTEGADEHVELTLQWVAVSAQTVSLHAMAAVGAEFSCLSSGLLKIFSCVKDLSHCLHFILSGLYLAIQAS